MKLMVVLCNAIGDNILSLIYFCKFYSKNLVRELNFKISEGERGFILNNYFAFS
jgi:hypothetical protein